MKKGQIVEATIYINPGRTKSVTRYAQVIATYPGGESISIETAHRGEGDNFGGLRLTIPSAQVKPAPPSQ